MNPADVLLDTSVVLHYARRSPVFEAIEARFSLVQSAFRPMVSIVTVGEIKGLAYYRGWSPHRLHQLDAFLANLVAIDISDAHVLEAYARISAYATRNGWSIHQKKNDIWIAATANVTGATLLTTDNDFTDPNDVFLKRLLYDNKTGRSLD